MEKTNLTISIDKKDKEMFQDLVNKLGLNISVAFNMFVKQSIRNNSLPLDLTLNELDSVSDRIMDKYDRAFEELSKWGLLLPMNVIYDSMTDKENMK